MQARIKSFRLGVVASALLLLMLPLSLAFAQQVASWPNYAHDSQHSAVSAVAAQPLSKIHWSTPVDLSPPSGEILIHYGSPLITAANVSSTVGKNCRKFVKRQQAVCRKTRLI